MVGTADLCLSWAFHLRDLFHLGGLARGSLYVRTLSVALLLAGTAGGIAACLVWASAGLVADVAALFTGLVDPVGAGVVSTHLLLLSRRLLQGLLGRPAFLHRERTAQVLPGREFFSAHPAERPP